MPFMKSTPPAYSSNMWLSSLFLSSLLLVLCSMIPTVSPTETDFLTEPLLGDFTSVENMRPRVILAFLSNCAGIPINLKSCLVQSFMEGTFPQQRWGTIITEWELDSSFLWTRFSRALDRCPSGTVGDEEINSLLQILTDTSCLSALGEDSSFYDIEAHWMDTCADINNIPSPKNADASKNGLCLASQRVEDEVALSCMVHFAMNEKASDPTLEGRKEACYPRGYQYMSNYYYCTLRLGPRALTHCCDIAIGWNQLISDFCSIMTDLSSPEGLSCLESICDHDEDTMAPTWALSTTESPTFGPSATPSLAPSTRPSSKPSTEPSVSPSDSPSTRPSLEPSLRPSDSPSTRPSLEPSLWPSDSPSSRPSPEPSIGPSTIPSSLPSGMPSSSPTSTPTTKFASKPDIVEVEFFIVIRLQNASAADVTNKTEETLFSNTVEYALDRVLEPIDGIVTVKVVSLTSPSFNSSLFDVELKIDISRLCYLADCSDTSLSDDILNDFLEVLESAIKSGAFTLAIQEEAEKKDLVALEAATVPEDQTLFVRYSVQVRESEEAIVISAFQGSKSPSSLVVVLVIASALASLS